MNQIKEVEIDQLVNLFPSVSRSCLERARGLLLSPDYDPASREGKVLLKDCPELYKDHPRKRMPIIHVMAQMFIGGRSFDEIGRKLTPPGAKRRGYG